MTVNVEAINAVPFEQIFMKLGIKTFPKGFGTRGIFENGKKTDGWCLNEKENMVNDFSGKRPKGDVIKFIEAYLWKDFKWAAEFIEQNFNISQAPKMNTIEKKPFEKIKELQTSDRANEYLKSRGINMSKLIGIVKPAIKKTYGKDLVLEGECIACEMRNTSKEIVGVQYRSLDGKAFYTDGNDWFFYAFDATTKDDKLFIVEWLTDYLSLRQYTTQVIWLKSCKTPIDDKFKKLCEKFKKVYLMLDNDEAGRDAKEKFKSIVTETKILEIVWNDKIDINDLALELGGDLIEGIESYAEVTQTSANDYNTMLSIEWAIDLSPGRYTWGTKWLDKQFGKFNKWGFNVIVGESSSGKTEFALFMGSKNADAGIKTMFISLEMDTASIYRRLALKQCGVWREELDAWLSPFRKEMVMNKVEELKKEKIKITGLWVEPNIENLKKVIKSAKDDWYEIFVIDSLDMIKVTGKNDSEFIPIITRELKELCNSHLISINLIHHFTKWSDKDRKDWRGLSSIKGSVKVENNADTIIKISRNMEEDEFGAMSDQSRKQVMVSLMKDRTYGNIASKAIYFIKWSYQDDYEA